MPRITAADIKHIEAGQRCDAADRSVHPTAPPLASRVPPRRIAEVLVIGLAAAHRVLAQLEMRAWTAVFEQREPHTGTECDDAFHVVPGNHTKSLHRRIVCQ